jgi:hypothetical protein
MKKLALIVAIVILIASCAMFDGISDVSISMNLPDEIIFVNNARVSTLRNVDGKIVRANTSVYQFHFDIDIPAGHRETVKIDDFIVQNRDEAIVTDAKFSWDM